MHTSNIYQHIYCCAKNMNAIIFMCVFTCNMFLNTQKLSSASRFSFKKFFVTLSVPEAKLLILFCFYWIAISLILHTVSFVIRNGDRALEKAQDFVLCSAGGYREECRPLEENLVDGNTIAGMVLVVTMNLFLTSASWANLFFLIQYQDLKILFRRLSNIGK